MRVCVATVQVPFISGGAEAMTAGLCRALGAAGHQVERVTMPFRFGPPSEVLRGMDAWEHEDFESFQCGSIDEVVALKFPAFYLRHPSKRVWLMHQHRSIYELWNTPFGDSSSSPDHVRLRDEVMRRDVQALQGARKVFTISPTVTERLWRFNHVESEPLFQPPPNAGLYVAGEPWPYVFIPSRLEAVKRQELVIRAMVQVAQPVFAVVAGEGGQSEALRRVVETLGLQHRVKFVGNLSDADMRRYYANALCVFFGPLQEDYGFVALEAMLAARPLITCTDSGCPALLVRHGETGYITEPEPGAIADAINTLWSELSRSREMGRAARQAYDAMGLSWDRVVATLLAA